MDTMSQDTKVVMTETTTTFTSAASTTPPASPAAPALAAAMTMPAAAMPAPPASPVPVIAAAMPAAAMSASPTVHEISHKFVETEDHLLEKKYFDKEMHSKIKSFKQSSAPRPKAESPTRKELEHVLSPDDKDKLTKKIPRVRESVKPVGSLAKAPPARKVMTKLDMVREARRKMKVVKDISAYVAEDKSDEDEEAFFARTLKKPAGKLFKKPDPTGYYCEEDLKSIMKFEEVKLCWEKRNDDRDVDDNFVETFGDLQGRFQSVDAYPINIYVHGLFYKHSGGVVYKLMNKKDYDVKSVVEFFA